MLKSMRKSKNRHFTTFLFPLAITLNVAWIEREFDAYKLPRCIWPSNYNRGANNRQIMVEKRDFSYAPCIRRNARGVGELFLGMAYGPTGGLGLRGGTSPAPHWNGLEWNGYTLDGFLATGH